MIRIPMATFVIGNNIVFLQSSYRSRRQRQTCQEIGLPLPTGSNYLIIFRKEVKDDVEMFYSGQLFYYVFVFALVRRGRRG